MRNWFIAVLVGVLALSTSVLAEDKPAAAPAADGKPIRALLVIGGCCHEYVKQKDILAKGIAERANVVVTIAYDPDASTKHLNPVYEKADWAKDFDVIIHDECSADVKDEAVIQTILAPHKEGLPGVILHCGMHSYRSKGYPQATPWFEFTGQPSITPFVLIGSLVWPLLVLFCPKVVAGAGSEMGKNTEVVCLPALSMA